MNLIIVIAALSLSVKAMRRSNIAEFAYSVRIRSNYPLVVVNFTGVIYTVTHFVRPHQHWSHQEA